MEVSQNWGFLFWGVPIIRTIVVEGLYVWVPGFRETTEYEGPLILTFNLRLDWMRLASMELEIWNEKDALDLFEMTPWRHI